MDTDTTPTPDAPVEATPAGPTVDTQPAAETAETATPDPGKLAAQLEHWKAMARKNEQRAKENAAAAKENAAAAAKLAEIEDAKKSEAEKLLAKLEAAEQRAAAAEQARIRAEIAQSKGVPADLLSGTTEEEMTASADRLLAFRGQQPAPEYGRSTDAPPTKPKQLNRADMARMTTEQIVEADNAGLFDDLKAGRL